MTEDKKNDNSSWFAYRMVLSKWYSSLTAKGHEPNTEMRSELGLFPRGARNMVVSRGHEFFAWDMNRDIRDFQKSFEECAKFVFGVKERAFDKDVFERTSFSGGVVGFERYMHTIVSSKRVRAVITYKFFRDSLLLMWRVIYVRNWSLLRVGGWILFSLFAGVALSITGGVDDFGELIQAGLFFTIFSMVSTALGLGFRSLAKGNFFWDWLRTNIDELHWEEVVIAENVLLMSMNVTALTYSLNRLSFDDKPDNVFSFRQSRKTPRL